MVPTHVCLVLLCTLHGVPAGRAGLRAAPLSPAPASNGPIQPDLPLLPADCSPADLLAARPRRRAGITLWQGVRHLASLRQLRLENQGGGAMPINALACSSLQGLTLLCAAAEDWPSSLLHRYCELCGGLVLLLAPWR